MNANHEELSREQQLVVTGGLAVEDQRFKPIARWPHPVLPRPELPKWPIPAPPILRPELPLQPIAPVEDFPKP